LRKQKNDEQILQFDVDDKVPQTLLPKKQSAKFAFAKFGRFKKLRLAAVQKAHSRRFIV